MTAEDIADLRRRCLGNDVFGSREVEPLLDEREALLKAAKDLASIVMYNEISDEQIALGEAAEAVIEKAEAP